MIPPGIEPGTLSVLDSRDNHYTTESLHHDSAKNQFFIQHKCTPPPLPFAAAQTKKRRKAKAPLNKKKTLQRFILYLT